MGNPRIQRVNPANLAAVGMLAVMLLMLLPSPCRAQNPEDELGNWLIYNGTIRFNPKWSIFTEAQLRLWEVVSNPNEAFVRVAGHYNFTPDALAGFGYLRAASWTFEDGDRERTEDRLYQQFTAWHGWARTRFEHRYRLEQRWFYEETGNRYSTRARYRLQITSPLNRKSMEPGAYFLNFYEEIFINFDAARSFDQNRLYGALGYQFTPLSNLQLGLLWQARSSADFLRLQIFYTRNFNVGEN
jgi:hypothetical protein